MAPREEEDNNGQEDHNAVSLFLIGLVQKTKADAIGKVIAPFFAEFFGTMMLTFVISLVAGSKLAPLAIGGILLSMIFTYGHLSGAHYNPAVSIAVYVRGKIITSTLLGYIVSQVIGGICGAMTAKYVFAENDYPMPLPHPSVNTGRAFLLEFLFTYTLCTTVLNTATTDSVGPNSFYGIAISFVVMSGAIASGGYSGAVFNPAVACGLFTANETTSKGLLGLYWLAPSLAGFQSGLMFHILNSDENKKVKVSDREVKYGNKEMFQPFLQDVSSNLSNEEVI